MIPTSGPLTSPCVHICAHTHKYIHTHLTPLNFPEDQEGKLGFLLILLNVLIKTAYIILTVAKNVEMVKQQPLSQDNVARTK